MNAKTSSMPPNKERMREILRLLIQAVTLYERDPKVILNDALVRAAIKAFSDIEPQLNKAYAVNDKNISIGLLVRDISKIYRAVRKGLISGRTLIMKSIREVLEKYNYICPITEKGTNFFYPTEDQLKEFGGPAELAKINVGKLVSQSKRTVHDRKIKRENVRKMWKDFTSRQLLEEEIALLLEVLLFFQEKESKRQAIRIVESLWDTR